MYGLMQKERFQSCNWTLHPNVLKACLEDHKLYELLALLDAI
jgi:hypothetical protein